MKRPRSRCQSLCGISLSSRGPVRQAVIDRHRAVPQRSLQAHQGRRAKAAERCRTIRLIDQRLPRRTKGLCGVVGQRIGRAGKGVKRGKGRGEFMAGRNRERRLPRQFQEPGQARGLAPEFLPNGGDLGSLSFRFERRDQPLELLAPLVGIEGFILGEARKIAKQMAKPAQSARLRSFHPFPRAAP